MSPDCIPYKNCQWLSFFSSAQGPTWPLPTVCSLHARHCWRTLVLQHMCCLFTTRGMHLVNDNADRKQKRRASCVIRQPRWWTEFMPHACIAMLKCEIYQKIRNSFEFRKVARYFQILSIIFSFFLPTNHVITSNKEVRLGRFRQAALNFVAQISTSKN